MACCLRQGLSALRLLSQSLACFDYLTHSGKQLLLQTRQLFLSLDIRQCQVLVLHQLRKLVPQRRNLIHKARYAVGLHQTAHCLIFLDIFAQKLLQRFLEKILRLKILQNRKIRIKLRFYRVILQNAAAQSMNSTDWRTFHLLQVLLPAHSFQICLRLLHAFTDSLTYTPLDFGSSLTCKGNCHNVRRVNT